MTTTTVSTIDLDTLAIMSVMTKVTDRLGEDLKRSLRENDRYATGKTEKEIESTMLGDSAVLMGPSYIKDLEYGKKPGEYPQIGRIREWCQARGIDIKRAESIRYAVYLRGYKGRAGVITNPLSDANVNNAVDQELENLALLIAKKVSDIIA